MFVYYQEFVTRKNIYLLTDWEDRTGKYLARDHGVRTARMNLSMNFSYYPEFETERKELVAQFSAFSLKKIESRKKLAELITVFIIFWNLRLEVFARKISAGKLYTVTEIISIQFFKRESNTKVDPFKGPIGRQ